MTNLNLLTLTPRIEYTSDEATEELFGANFLFNRDGTQKTSEISTAYQEFAKETGLSTLRYPGGTISEVLFDIANPNAEGAYDQGKKGTIPLTDFLEYAASIGASATIVMPTYRLLSEELDSSGNHLIDISQKSIVKEFVKFALSEAERLGTSIAAFELGNEWWVDNSAAFGFRMSPIEYGRVANFLAEAIEEAVVEYNLMQHEANVVDPDIVIQVGPSGEAEWFSRAELGIPDEGTGLDIAATEVIFRQITSPIAQAAIDGTVMHRYLHGTDEMISGWIYKPFQIWDLLARNTPGFQIDVQRYVTEWNVSSRNQDEIGLKQFDTMVLLVEEMLRAGIDLANVWAVQQNNNTRMIYNTGLKDDPFGGLTFGGLAFDMMAAQLPGQRIVMQSGSLAGLHSVVFGSEQKFIYFLSNKSESSRTDTLSLSWLPANAHHVSLYSVERGADGKPDVTVTTIDLRTTTQAQILQFAANETVMIVVARGATGSFIEGYNQADTLSGSGYDDTILGGDNHDRLSGQAGDDRLEGEAGNDVLYGGDGNDVLFGGAGDDLLYGGAGNDLLFADGGNDTVFGGAGFDIVSLVDVNVDITLDLGFAQEAPSAVAGGFVSEVEGVISGSGNDAIRGDSGPNSISGGAGNDTLSGMAGSDTLSGDEGNDSIDGGEGDDFLWGGSGADTLAGGDGSDLIRGEDGNDLIFGGLGFDVLEGGSGNDTLFGGTGIDVLLGQEGDDFLYGGFEGDRIFGGNGEDVLLGEDGFDILDGGSGNDTMYGGADDDYMLGGEGNDLIFGDSGNDILIGGLGDDTLTGGAGDDILSGGAGADHFVFISTTSGVDIITDFNELNGGGEEGDILRFEGLGIGAFIYLGTGAFTGGSDNSEARVVGNQVLVDTNGDGTADITITLTGLTNANQLSADDFLFV